MSVRRSSPSTLIPLDSSIYPTHHNSDSALNEMSKASDLVDKHVNVSKRYKRTLDDIESSPGCTSEIKYLLEEIRTQQESKFELLNNALITITSQNQEIQKSVETLTARHADLLVKVNNLEQENTEYKRRVLALERNLNHLESNVRSSTIEIRNLPKQENESKQVLVETIQRLGSTLELDQGILQSEIRDIFRSKSEALIVDFTTTTRKESLVSKFKAYNKIRRENKQAQLNSQLINLPGTPCTLYISEYLTFKARRLFYLARLNVKNKELHAAWTSHGKIYVKREENASPVRIDDEADLQKLFL